MSRLHLAYVDPHCEERLSLVSDEDELEGRGTGVKSPVARLAADRLFAACVCAIWAPAKYEIATSTMYKPK